MKGQKLNLAGRVFLGILALAGAAKVSQGKGRLDIVNSIESYASQWVRIFHSSKTGVSEGLDSSGDLIFDPNTTLYDIGSKIVSIVEEKELFKDYRPENSTGNINLELSIHQTRAPRGSPITIDSSNELWISMPTTGEYFDNKPITFWERTIIDPNENPNDPNNYTISFMADIREAIDKSDFYPGGRKTARLILPHLSATPGSEIPYMYTQTRFNTFPGDFNLDGKVDLEDYARLMQYWGWRRNPENPEERCLADISGPQGVPDGKVDMWDLALFMRDWLKDIRDIMPEA